ncbi:hypothetical protein GCM10009819_08910 [Agromyces tropicus]|uniref:Transposase n=1 Tax=Agromyces tropicus TaxID=555371 RepID=A0ABP5FLH6_9MICO
MATDPVAEAADALYALVPEEFTAARNARAGDALAGGDPVVAKAIGALRRPSPSAWIVNRLARDEPDRVGDLVGLGGELADAQAAGDGRALGALVAERRELIGDLLRLASGLAEAADRSPSRAVLDEVEQTLVAASVSAEAGAAVASGRLVRGLRAVGVEVDLAGAVGGGEPGPPRRLGRKRSDREGRSDAAGRATQTARGRGGGDGDDSRSTSSRADRSEAAARRGRERRAAELEAIRRRAEADAEALIEASDRLRAATERVRALEAERDELDRRMAEVRAEVRPAEREVRSATRAHEAAEAEASRSRTALEAARADADGDRDDDAG